ncbi:MAG: hypothetical protein ACE5PO_03830 [Candidatus Bathyarchaeia archaeon]
MYDELYQHWLKEDEAQDLQPLAKDFYIKLAAYRKELQAEVQVAEDTLPRTRILKLELENGRQLMENLFQLRLRKMLDYLAQNRPVSLDLLASEEVEVYNQLLNAFRHAGEILGSIEKGRHAEPSTSPRDTKGIIVRFLQDTPAIVGADMKIYGPYQKEDVASLPLENAEILIKTGTAKKVTSV